MKGPPDEDLGRVAFVFCSHGCDDGVIQFSTDDRTVRLDDDAVLGAVFYDWFLLAKGVELYKM